MAAPIFAYLDNNATSDLSEPRLPVDRSMRKEFLAAVAGGRLAIPFSEAVAQEIAALSLINREKEGQLARFYLKIASLDHALEPSGRALRQAVSEFLGDASVSPFTALSARERRNVTLRLSGKARSHLDALVAEYHAESDTWAGNSKGYRDEARNLIQAEAEARGHKPPRPAPLRDVVTPIWPNLAPEWAHGMVESQGLLQRARAAGMTDADLLRIPGVRAAVGVAVALAVAQTVNGRNPELADFGDFQHVALAACTRLPLVTHDERLCKLVEAIPDPPLEVISVEELLHRVQQQAE